MLRAVITRDELLRASNRELMRVLREGHAIDPTRLDDYEYRGISLGLPGFIEKLTWKTFQKTFHRDPETGVLRGWNVRLEQRGLDAASVPKQKNGEPVTFGHYHVVPLIPAENPGNLVEGLLIHYGLGENHGFGSFNLARDPLVAVNEGSVELLLGWTWLAVGPLKIRTPSFFALERERPLTHRVAPPGRRALAGRRAA
jgi:hypothetical protein